MSLLNLYSTPAERLRRCSFAERFEGPAQLVKNNGIITGGAVTWVNNGLQFPGGAVYIDYTSSVAALNNTQVAFCGVVEFTPDFPASSGNEKRFVLTGQHYILKSNTNVIIVYRNPSTAIFTSDAASVAANWKQGEVNRLAWTCVSGANYVYLNGVLLTSASYTTAWTATQSNLLKIGSTTNAFSGIIHSVKLFTPATAAQALTQRDCEVLSAGTTYTYWNSATCIMAGLSANYDIGNYRHLDLSGQGNHVLLGNGAGTGTPTKLGTQGYSFNGSTQYMTVPLAAWPGSAGTMLFDVNVNTNTTTWRLFGTDHTLGSNYEVFSSVSAPNNRIIMGTGVGQVAVSLGLDKRYQKLIVGGTWLTSGSLRGYQDGQFIGSTAIGATTPYTPDLAWWLMQYSGSYSPGVLRSFVSFSRELSSIQLADATLWMKKLRNRV